MQVVGNQHALRDSVSVGFGSSQSSAFLITPWKTLTQIFEGERITLHTCQKNSITCDSKEKSPNTIMLC